MVSRSIRIPPDVLDRIFTELEAIVHISGSLDFRPTSCLHPLLFVCKEWHAAAGRRLYSRVGLDTRKTLKNPLNRNCDLFLTSIKSKPGLASLVREISLAVSFESREGSFSHAQILRLCPKVRSVRIGGTHNKFLDDINTALAQKNLIELRFERLIPPDNGAWPTNRKMVFRTTSEIIRYLFDFPHLQRLTSSTNVTLDTRDCDYDDDSILPRSLSVTVGCCPALHTFEMQGSVLKPTHLQLLSEIAPNVKYVAFALKGSSADTFGECLCKWSSSLVRISLMVLEPDVRRTVERLAVVLREDNPLRPLRHLELWLGSRYIKNGIEATQIQAAGKAIGELCNKQQIHLDCWEKNSRGQYVLRTYNY
ncbi:hypothetical protein SCHPADRAFT_204123 [Schizopora paradoxa]|uniref:F-box domain-containing protein n=1 Tax=Schizopora paradoxa TaxID=27342 RepID=A0A0H2RWZ3_9AGAM|nr:hypothetical protein SCHPADRAFT_204123 [Schizopora paradoxa]